jgi:hypothetical protein
MDFQGVVSLYRFFIVSCLYAYSDDVGRAFRFDLGHPFRLKSAGRSD